MLEQFCASIVRPICFSLSFPCRIRYISKCASCLMDHENLLPSGRSLANFRLCSVSGYTTELLDLHAEEPKLHVLFIPGNPGIVSFYKDFVESLYELLGGSVSVTGKELVAAYTSIGHVSHTKKNWEHGRLFTLQDQIDHKMDFIQHELKNIDAPILLVGHSIGAYISMEMFRRSPDKERGSLALALQFSLSDKNGLSPILCAALSSIVAFLGLLPRWASGFIVSNSLGKSWSSTAVEALCSHLLKVNPCS
ncbi:Lipid droplet-associated hydrolase [Vitis vinifera]|uniref:Lipid droplet-associated hydrolase n=1 Tax=Vitis vinifera TaxID=29760 RepID=A0A438JAG4_VITVI|nr:Lipid droplet-associated hydrolase [Vitis vinifera]RVX05954.1 Lipid droplet-associated hydrolase [Vitis vinifera]